ncbi:MAG: NAD(P)/FAD-dependent oxidoreductase [Paracoccaceae bacterium]
MNPLHRNDRPGRFPDSWYAATCDLPAERPTLKGARRADVAIVGAGYTGLWAAKTLAERGFDTVVLDAHRAGWGASGRNGGQVHGGWNVGMRDLARRIGPDAARAAWDLSVEAVDMVRDFAADRPDVLFREGLIEGRWTDAGVRALHQGARVLGDEYGARTEPLDRDAFRAICPSPVYRGGLLDSRSGHLHPLRYAFALARAAEEAGATIHERSEVHAIDGTTLRTGQGRVEADHVILAGNGYLPGLHRDVSARVMPINSFIAATEPLGDRAVEVLRRDVAVADDKFVVNYFRLSHDRRLLFGGRESYSLGFPRDILPALRKRMLTLFPSLRDVAITHHWGGTLGITMTRLPMVRRIGPASIAAAGFSGHGVALAGLAGRAAALAIAGQAERLDVLSRLPTGRFPGGAVARAPLLALGMTWYSLRDRLGI